MHSRLRRKLHKQSDELNITAFMNLMVILVPFLLITAVFSRMTILELNIPPPSQVQDNEQPDPKDFQLVVTIRKDGLEVGDTNGGLIRAIDKQDGQYNYRELSDLLQQIKVRFPEKTNANILSELDVSYNTLVQVMDKVRVAEQVQAGAVVKAELFPDIAIGDAPPRQN